MPRPGATSGLLHPRQQGLAQRLALAELPFERGAGLAVFVDHGDARDLEELVAVITQRADVYRTVARLRCHLEAAREVGLLHAVTADVEEQHAAQDIRGSGLAAHEE